MIVLIGSLVVLGAVIVGFLLSGGHVAALFHPAELLTIGGAAVGALIMMSPRKVLIDLLHGLIAAIKGSPYNRQAYRELLSAGYELLRTARRDGLLAIEHHISRPGESSILQTYPRISGNARVLEFLCAGLAPVADGLANAQDLSDAMQAELGVMEAESHAPHVVLSKTADALPGFGIVAAVMGIVITMGSIDGPVEEVGQKVGAALVGTFLGILLSYGFFGPLASRMEFIAAEQMAFFRALGGLIVAFSGDVAPRVAVEQVRRGLGSEVRPSAGELETLLKELDKRQ